MNDLISIIIPVYNVEKYLDRCIESVVNQSYHNLEIILIDDGSPDNSGAICDAWAEKDSRIRVIHKENGGLSDARNAGIAKSSGEYISFIDSDDWVTTDFLKILLELIKQDNSDVAACGVQMVWEDDTPSKMLTSGFSGTLLTQEIQHSLLSETHIKQPVWYKLYRRDIVCHIPFKVGKYHEDSFWTYRVLAQAKKISITEKIGYFYLQRNGSIMGSQYSLKRLHAIEAACERQEYYKEHFPELLTDATDKLWGAVLYHGQQALCFMNNEDQHKVFIFLKSVLKKYPMKIFGHTYSSMTHKLWILFEMISLKGTCRLRNLLKIGI